MALLCDLELHWLDTDDPAVVSQGCPACWQETAQALAEQADHCTNDEHDHPHDGERAANRWFGVDNWWACNKCLETAREFRDTVPCPNSHLQVLRPDEVPGNGLILVDGMPYNDILHDAQYYYDILDAMESDHQTRRGAVVIGLTDTT